MNQNQDEARMPAGSGDLAGKLSAAGWGLFIIWIGISFLASLAAWITLLGIGVITLGMQVIRKSVGLSLEGFWVVVGFLFVLGGIWALLGTTVPLLPILLIVAGVVLLFSIFIGIFLVTAVLGRVWCGWACPQTVYMEYLYRPLEVLIEGGRNRQLEMDSEGADARRLIKNLVFLAISAFLANTFLAYFVGWDQLLNWMTSPPTQHPMAFAIMLGTTLLMFFDFAYFREQTCIVACPYGRFQSVLLDKQSLIVGYDGNRGGPRAKWRRSSGDGFADPWTRWSIATRSESSMSAPRTTSTRPTSWPHSGRASTCCARSRWRPRRW